MFVIPFMQPFGTHPFVTCFGIVPCGTIQTWFAKQVPSKCQATPRAKATQAKTFTLISKCINHQLNPRRKLRTTTACWEMILY